MRSRTDGVSGRWVRVASQGVHSSTSPTDVPADAVSSSGEGVWVQRGVTLPGTRSSYASTY